MKLRPLFFRFRARRAIRRGRRVARELERLGFQVQAVGIGISLRAVERLTFVAHVQRESEDMDRG